MADFSPNSLLTWLFLKIYGYYVIDIVDLLFCWVALTFCIACLGTPDFVTFTGGLHIMWNGAPIASQYIISNVGVTMWKVAITDPRIQQGTYVSEWRFMKSDCSATFDNFIGAQNPNGLPTFSCQTFNSFRIICILGVVCLGIVCTIRTIFFIPKCHFHLLPKCEKWSLHVTLLLFGSMCFLLPAANWIIYDMIMNDFNNAHNGSSAALLSSGWIVGIVSLLLSFIRCAYINKMDEYMESQHINKVDAAI